MLDHRTGEINTWTLGIQKPLPKLKKGAIAKPQIIPEITIQHIKVAFAVLSFWKGKTLVPISVNELALRVANSRGGRYSRDLLQKLYDLRDFWVSVKNPAGRTDYFPILQKIHLHEDAPRKAHSSGAQEELWLDEIELSPEFANLLVDYSRSMDLNFDTLREIKSGIVQSTYLFLPSRAVHHSKENPFKVTTSRLWLDLELDPAPKSRRRQILTQNKPSIIEQLDGLKLLSGRLRVALEETVDKSDWNLLAWVEKSPQPFLSGGKLRDAWLASGRSQEGFKTRIDKVQNLDSYETDILSFLGIDIEAGELFFCHAKALLGGLAFAKLLSEAKADLLEGRSDVKSWEGPTSSSSPFFLVLRS